MIAILITTGVALIATFVILLRKDSKEKVEKLRQDKNWELYMQRENDRILAERESVRIRPKPELNGSLPNIK